MKTYLRLFSCFAVALLPVVAGAATPTYPVTTTDTNLQSASLYARTGGGVTQTFDQVSVTGLIVRTAATLPATTTINGVTAVGSYFPSTYFHVRMTNTTWFCTNGAYTSYKYDTEDADLGGAYSTTTYAYTVPSSGYYSFVASGGASYMTNSYTIMSIYTNGVRWGAGIGSPAAPTADFPNTRSMVFWDGYLSSGVTVSAWTYLGSDTANRTMHSGVQAFFSGWRMY